MKNLKEILQKTPLFKGIDKNDIDSLLNCLSAKTAKYKKGDFVFRAESSVTNVGIVLSGSLHIIQEDFWGNRTIVAHILPKELFGEAFSFAHLNKSPVSALATTDSELLLINYSKILDICPSSCVFHNKLIKNMTEILANKNVLLTEKMRFLSKRTIRDKVLSYLSSIALKIKNNTIKIPFNRQELADFLCVDRSALSRELSKMENEGILKYSKNTFVLLKN